MLTHIDGKLTKVTPDSWHELCYRGRRPLPEGIEPDSQAELEFLRNELKGPDPVPYTKQHELYHRYVGYRIGELGVKLGLL